jgi:5-methylcytosine-specific restriction endonuclease McrA
MDTHFLGRLGDRELLDALATAVARERGELAVVLTHIAEVDARRLYLPAGYPSMHVYCVGELRFSEDAAYKRIQAARAAREFPGIFEAVGDGRLTLTAVVRLKPYLTGANADVLLKAAENRTKSEIEEFIARRFPKSEMLALVQPLSAGSGAGSGSAGLDGAGAAASDGEGQRVPEPVGASTRQRVPEPVAAPRPRVAPIAPERFMLQLTIGKSTHDLLRQAQELLSHQVPSGDVAEVLHRALVLLVAKLERDKFARTNRPQKHTRPTRGPRHIPARVKRAVWERDQGQCTFVSESGRRCGSRKFLEYDHVEPVARGGRATVEGVRLRCRAHNQYAAECVFGAGFMSAKREAARAAANVQTAETRGRAAAVDAHQREQSTGGG